MLKLVIVDDEQLERDGLKNNIRWANMGISVTGVFENGMDCFNAVSKDVPDIILTDIRMPFMDGLTLAENIRKISQKTKFVFLTAYEDFGYAKRAVEINGARYILKPYEIEEILNIINEISLEVTKEKALDTEYRSLQKKLKESLPLLKEKFCADLLAGNYQTMDKDVIISRMKLFEIPLETDGECFVSVVSVENFNQLVDGMDEYGRRIWELGMQEFIETYINKGVCINVREGIFALVLSYKNGTENSVHNYNCMEGLMDALQKKYGASIVIGIGNSCSIYEAYIACNQALESTNYKFTFGVDNVICFCDVDIGNTTHMNVFLGRLNDEILELIKQGNEMEIENKIKLMFQTLSQNNADKLYIQNTCIDIINRLSKYLIGTGTDIDAMFGEGTSIIGKLLKFDTIHDTGMWMKNVLVLICRYLNKQKNTRNKKLIEQMKAVIKERFADDITVSDIASEVYLSPSYATMLFKKQTGKSIMKYIIKTRIEHAKKMLTDPTSRIAEVSESVGYSNLAYFTTLFKSEVGISPREYRNRHANAVSVKPGVNLNEQDERD